ncbi:MAG: hypothetical protein H0W84_09560 [Bacteroidetes bacterium]|nr:hypothetical protein [Bacteroidota bacterium]
MITKLLYALLAGLFLLPLLSSCEKKKYPEDEHRSWHSSCWRLKGKWKIDKIVYNGNDITSTYNDTLTPYSANDFIFDIRFGADVGVRDKKNMVFITTVNQNQIGNIEFYIDPKIDRMGFSKASDFQNIEDPLSYQKITNTLFNYWNVKKLYNKQLHIQSINTSYDLYFKQ